MPTTFDETMVDFGFRLSHKHLMDELHASLNQLEKIVKGNGKERLDEPCARVAEIFEHLVRNHHPNKKNLPSNTNHLYRKVCE
jgi:hypothetical protein